VVGVFTTHRFHTKRKQYTMKTIDKLIAFFISVAMFLAVLLVTGCQDEVEEVITPPPEEAITSNSNVANLLTRTTLRDGSADNILDSTSCTSIVLPITVIANGLEITIDNEDDFVVLERLFEELDDDDDFLEFIFPINVILADHSEIVINNEQELEGILDDCTEGGDDDDIECIDFNYPISVNVFDTNSQVAEVVTLNNDQELYNFLEELDDDDLVSINFPITVVLSNGEEIVVQDNEELEDVIEDAEDDCDEDDDNDFDDDDVDDSEFVSVLIDGEWKISEFVNETDQDIDFSGFTFRFFEDGDAKAFGNGGIVDGEWETSGDDGIIEFELEFDDDFPLEVLDEDWGVVEFDQNIIRLFGTDDRNDTSHVLTFVRPMDNGGGDSTLISEIIVEGQWEVAKYEDAGFDETDSYEGYSLIFSPQGTMIAMSDMDSVFGNWSEIFGNGDPQFNLDFEASELFEELDNDWEIGSVTEDRIELRELVGGDAISRLLVLERITDDGGSNDMSVSEVISEGQWIVALYMAGNSNETTDYDDFTLDFTNDSTVIATNGNDTFEGFWSDLSDDDEQVLLLDFEVGLFDEFNEDWRVTAIREDRIALADENDVLVFERIE